MLVSWLTGDVRTAIAARVLGALLIVAISPVLRDGK